MARVSFTPHLQRFLDVPPVEVAATTVREALEAVFRRNPRLRSYVLDDHDRVRQHVSIYVGDRPLADRAALTDAVGPDTEVYVLQALSGGAAPRPGDP